MPQPSPQQSDDATETDEVERPDSAGAEQELSTGQSSGRRKLLNRTKEAMPNVSYARLVDLQNGEMELTAYHPDLTRQGGRSSLVAEILSGVDRVWQELTSGVGSWTSSLAFERSVTVRLRAIPDREDQVETATRLAKEAPDAPASREQVLSLIPDGVAAAEVTARLLALPPEEGPEQAARYGGGVVLAYRALARVLQNEGITVEVDSSPTGRQAKMTPETAAAILKRLQEPVAVPPIDLVVYGTLVRQDSEDAEFRVRIDKERAQPPQVSRRKYVAGAYTETAKQDAAKHNLWDRPVRAKVRAHREVVPGRDEPKIVRFDFTSLALRDEN
jgi:hypothetical protein